MNQRQKGYSLYEWLVIAVIVAFGILIVIDDVSGIRRDKNAEFLPKTGGILIITKNTSSPQEASAALVPDTYKINRVASISDLNYIELISSDQTKRIVLSYEQFSYTLKHSEFTVIASGNSIPPTPTPFER